MDTASRVKESLAPGGVLRVSINYGNPVLACRNVNAGKPGGISIDIAEELARRLGVAIEFLTFDAARKSVAALETGQADLGFFAADPERSQQIYFTQPYLTIEAGYMVHEQSPLQSIQDIDHPGIRIAVGKGSAYDLFLTRNMQHAEMVRADNPATVIDVFMSQNLEVAAGVKQQLLADMKKVPGLRMLDGRFMEINQSVALPMQKGPHVHGCINAFVKQIKESGFIAAAVERHDISGVRIP